LGDKRQNKGGGELIRTSHIHQKLSSQGRGHTQGGKVFGVRKFWGEEQTLLAKKQERRGEEEKGFLGTIRIVTCHGNIVRTSQQKKSAKWKNGKLAN